MDPLPSDEALQGVLVPAGVPDATAELLAARPELEEVFAETLLNASEARAPSTRAAYAQDWADFSAWCLAKGVSALPALPVVVAMYASDLALRGLKVATISRRLAALAVQHRQAEHPSPTDDPHVRQVLRGIRRRYGAPQAAKAALSVGGLRALCDGAPEGPAGLTSLRDRAVLLCGFAGAFRRSELVALQVSDLTWLPEGVRVVVRRSKTDQEGRGAVKFLGRGADPATCPVRALRAWLDAAGIGAGAVFRKVDHHGNVWARALCPAAVQQIVKRAARGAELDPGPLAAHSLRSGFATSAAANGVDLPKIMRQTGHRSAQVAMGYVQEGALRAGDLSRAAGL